MTHSCVPKASHPTHTMSEDSSATLIIGATGTVGQSVVQQLGAYGAPVRAATRQPEFYDAPHAEAVAFEYTDPATYASALRNAKRVFMLAPPDMEAYGYLVPFLDAAANAGTEQIVLMTAMGVEQAPPEVPLRRAELHVQELDIASTIVRPNWFMQNFLTYWRGMIEHDGTMRLPAANTATSFVDTRDIAAVSVAALTEDGHAGHAYTVTGPEALTYHEAADVLSKAWDRDIRYEPVSDETALQIFTSAGLDDDYAQMLVGLFQDVKAGHAAPVTPDVEDATGRVPRSLQQFASDMAGAW